MASTRLTTRTVEALRTDRVQEDFWDTGCPGLLLRVASSGRKTWYVRYRVGKRHRRFKLGTFPALTLADARKRAREVALAVTNGGDPALAREDRRAALNTFRALAEEVLEGRKGRTRPGTQRVRWSAVEKDLLPAWGDRAAASITRREVVQMVEAIARRGSTVQANRTLSIIKLIFNDGIRRGFPGLEASPAHLVQPPTQEMPRERLLELHELRAVWTATEPENPLTRAAFRLALLTAQRMGSVLSLRWGDIDGDLWTIPAEYFKGRRRHLVPLSHEALAVLDELRDGSIDPTWAFPSRAGSRAPHLTNLAGALSRIRARSALPHWTAHDFRTAFRTHALRAREGRAGEPRGLGIPAHVADAVLGHAEGTVGFHHYTADRVRYLLSEKRNALESWGALVAAAVGNVAS